MADYSSYQQNQPYGLKDHERLRRVLPPAEIDHNGNTSMLRVPEHCIPPQHIDSRYGNPLFINTLTKSTSPHFENCMADWKYRHRQGAQTILPFLMLGSLQFARDIDQVREARITMVIAVRSRASVERQPRLMDPSRFPSATGLVTATFDVDSAYDAVSGRTAIIRAMNDHLEAAYGNRSDLKSDEIPAHILIFCETGNDRSPILVIMYLMVVWGLDSATAYHAVQLRRLGIVSSPLMIATTQVLDNILEAERLVASTTSGGDDSHLPGLSIRSGSVKRSIDDAYDNGEAMDMDIDNDTTQDQHIRPGVAPFRDFGH